MTARTPISAATLLARAPRQVRSRTCQPHRSGRLAGPVHHRLPHLGERDLAYSGPARQPPVRGRLRYRNSDGHPPLTLDRTPTSGQPRQFAEFLKQRRPHASYRGREYWSNVPITLGSMIRDPMYEYIQMKVGGDSLTSGYNGGDWALALHRKRTKDIPG